MLTRDSPEFPEEYASFSLLGYAAYQWPGYNAAHHHRLIAAKLEAVERGEIKRLMIFMPPRHGKSMLASEFFPAWYLGRNPSNYVIAATYAQDLADDFGRKVRNQIKDETFAGIFPGIALREDSSAVRRFHISQPVDALQTSQAGAYFAVGVGGPLTGRGAHLLLIDDPVKNREEAESKVIRDRTQNWYTSTAYTRLMPGGAIIVIQTRWHESDLGGWLLEEHKHENWEVLDLPAISAEGKALWPEQYDVKALDDIRKAIGPRDWSALYQQRPTPETGEFFRTEWFKSYATENMPKRSTLEVYGGSDYATTQDGGDFSVHVIFGIDPEGNAWLLDIWRKQTSSDKWVDSWCSLVLKWKPIGWAEETGQIKSGVGPFLDRESRARKAYCARESFATNRGGKATRAQSFRGYASQYGIYVPADHEAWPDCRRELLTFPAGVHDDFVDACALVFQLLDHMTNGRAPLEPEPDGGDQAYQSREDEWSDMDSGFDKAI
jgi:predicted phage terminase large subunit-like protein